jgi:hypothetical protein
MFFRNLFYFSFFIFSFVNAQRLENYIVLANKDSIICSSIVHGTSSNGRLNFLKYTTQDGKKFEYTSRFKVPKLDCFHYDGKTYEMIPRRSYRPRKRNIVGKRLADGEISYCYYNNEKFFTNTSMMGPSGFQGTQKSGFKLRYVKFKNGTYLKLTRRTMRKRIKPLLKSCDAFVKEYTGSYKLLRLEVLGNGAAIMFNLYNRVCATSTP